ncbi:MAG: zinc ribbon domain-containing protein [Erysipelotrichaceae bacterium]
MEIFLAFVLVFAVAIAILVFYIKSKARKLSRQLFQTDSLIDGYQNQLEELSNIPKSVSGMTRIYLPQIAKDFPEFNYEEFKQRSQVMLLSSFKAISKNNVGLLENASPDLTSKIALKIDDNIQQNRKETYQNVKIHQAEITDYRKLSGTCIITLQYALGYKYTLYEENRLVDGSETLKEQCRYNVDIIYIQDVGLMDSTTQTAFESVKCPNCGAPVKTLGHKVCEYCGSKVEQVNVRVWCINDFRKI